MKSKTNRYYQCANCEHKGLIEVAESTDGENITVEVKKCDHCKHQYYIKGLGKLFTLINPDDLKQYGKLEVLKINDNKLHVKITTGFNPQAINTFGLIEKIETLTHSRFPNIEFMHTDTDIFECILKP